MVAGSLICVEKNQSRKGMSDGITVTCLVIIFFMTFVCLYDVPAVVSEEEMGDRSASLIHSK